MSDHALNAELGSKHVEAPVLEKKWALPFVLVTSLFALWGFANDVTNPLVNAFQRIFLISHAQSALVQFAFYFGYFTMALPAALLISRRGYKSGIVVGLALYALGAFMVIPAGALMNFWLLILSFYILTFGLAFLETTANPYILSMGHPDTATRRLNLAQAFNPMGSLTGMFIASNFILARISVAKFESAEALQEFSRESPQAFADMQLHDLEIVQLPYIGVGMVVVVMLVVFIFSKMPDNQDSSRLASSIGETVRRLNRNPAYRGGVIAQTFYVGAQIMCWTFIIHYGVEVIGIGAAEAQNYNIIAMLIFVSSRFICTFLLRYLNPGLLLAILSLCAVPLLSIVIFIGGFDGLYALIAVSACMSLMFPTIYGLALNGLGDDAKLGSAGLIMAIVGGAIMPVMQGALIDAGSPLAGVHAVQFSFILPLLCFLVVAGYGWTRRA